MTELRVASIDGWGESDDQALARDRARETIEDNRRKNWDEAERAVDNAREYGSNPDAQQLSAIIKDMLMKECYGKKILKSLIVGDMELGEALNEACIQLGLDEEEYSPYSHDLGDEISLSL
jgi:hypothetical protein